MCLYSRLIPNPKYKPNIKNGGHPEKPRDKRLMAVAIGCGKCIECRKKLARDWKIRMSEELEEAEEKGIQRYFVTLTFSNENIEKYRNLASEKNNGEIDDNEAVTIAVRHFLERWRKTYKKSFKHWLITELGHEGTERIHVHGVIFTNEPLRQNLLKHWKNGWINIGEYCNRRTINYIVKYVTKIDNDHPEFNGKILCSSGLGQHYIKKGIRFNKYKGKDTKEYYRSKEGYKMQLPIYYRNHIYSEKEREELWLQTMDKKELYILGVKYDISTQQGITNYINALKQGQETSERNGYGKPKWNENDYRKSLTYFNIN